MHDTANAFTECFTLDGAPGGPLAGTTFAAKDIFDVAGHVTGCGNPDWARTHPPAATHADAVATLLAAGARLIGKSHTDELAYSLMGANAHTGTPRNTADPRRVPGGSSSGSVAAVAAGLCDIGLGSDTGGSVRLPASYCGVFGLRTTHGRIPLGGTMALAPSFDTVGWFTRDVALLDRVAAAFGLPDDAPPTRLLLPVDAWALAEPDTLAALAPTLRQLEALTGPAVPVRYTADDLLAWFHTFRIAQAAEVWQVHGEWVTATRPAFGPGVSDRFAMAAAIDAAAMRKAQAERSDIAADLLAMIPPGTAVVIPTSPGPAPFRDANEADLNHHRQEALKLLCPAGFAGLPQLNLPAGVVDRGPVGLSLVGAKGADRGLLALARAALTETTSAGT